MPVLEFILKSAAFIICLVYVMYYLASVWYAIQIHIVSGLMK